MLLVPSRVTHAGGTHALPLRGRNQSSLASLSPSMLQMYVLSILDVIRGILQLFHMDVAKVDRDVAFVANCFRGMLQLFQRHVASVCLKCFICFRRMLQALFI
jgi:hypothetical protein